MSALPQPAPEPRRKPETQRFEATDEEIVARYLASDDFSKLEQEQLVFCFRRCVHQRPAVAVSAMIRILQILGAHPGNLQLQRFYKLVLGELPR